MNYKPISTSYTLMYRRIFPFFDALVYIPTLDRTAYLALFFFFWSLSPSFCEQKLDLDHLTIRSFTCPEDLPNDVVRDVIMTRDGSVWIATWGGGVVVMNGTTKRLINKQSGLISDDVRVLEEDQQGRVWVGTAEGISCIQNQEIINFSTMPSLEISDNDSIFSIESIHNGEVWFGDGIGNLFAWVPSEDSPSVKNGNWKYVSNFRKFMSDKTVEECSLRRIEQYKDQSIWFAVNGVGMIKINSPADLNAIVYAPGIFSSNCFDLLIKDSTQQYSLDYQVLGMIDQVHGRYAYAAPATCKCLSFAFGTIFLGTEQGLYNLNGRQFSLIPLTKNNRLYCIESISPLRDGSVWIGTRNGAFRITQTPWIPQSFSSGYTSLFTENYSPEFKRKALALDDEYRLWAYQDHNWQTVHRFDHPFVLEPNEQFIPQNFLYARENKLHIQHGAQCIHFDLSHKKITDHYLIPRYLTGKYQTYINDRLDIWYTGQEGVLRKEGTDFVPVFHLPPDMNHEVFSILQTAPDSFWLGGKGWIGQYLGGIFESVVLPSAYQSGKASIIRSLQTQEGELWFSQLGQGILRYDGSQWCRDNGKTGLPSNYIMSLMQSSDGVIWAGDRNNGVMSYKDGRWIKYDDADGIPEGTVWSIVEDEDGHLWINLINKILLDSRYSPEILEFQPDCDPPAVQIVSASTRLLPDSPGLFSFQGYDAWNVTLREQLVYSWRVLQSRQGKVIQNWNPYTSSTSAVISPLPPGEYIFEVRVQDRFRNNSPVRSAVFVVDPYFWMNRYFQVPFACAVFFAALSLYMNRKRYKQQMENRLLQEKMNFMKFCEISNIGMLRLSPDGKILSVNQAMAEICGFENERHLIDYPAPLQWKHSDQFEDFVHSMVQSNSSQHALLLGSQPLSGNEFYVFLYGNYKERLLEIIALDLTPQMNVDHRVLQAHVEQQQKIGQDLHDSVAQDLSAMMNKIQLIKQFPKIDINDIDFLDQGIITTYQKIRQMSIGFSPIDFSEIDLVTSLEEIRYDLENTYSEPEYQFDIQPDIPVLDKKTQDHLYNIVHEALYNAAKHSKANLISLRTETRDNRLILTVQDNGIGIVRKKKSRGLGLNNMRRRANLLGAQLSIDPHPDGGTVIQCILLIPE